MTGRDSTRLEGWASLRGHRVSVSGRADADHLRVVGEAEVLEGFEPVPADATYGYSREPWAVADVPRGALSHLALFETLVREGATEVPRDVGLSARVGGVAMRMVDSRGHVVDGEPHVQVCWSGERPPTELAWTPHAGRWLASAPRSAVSEIVRRTAHARWRGADVEVARVDDDLALVFALRGGVPFEAPEIAATDNVRSGWSAIVRLNELEPRSTSESRGPLGPVDFPLAVAWVDGVAGQAGLAEVDGGLRTDLAVLAQSPASTPEPGMVLAAEVQWSASPMRWRRFVPTSDVERSERVVTEASVDGIWQVVTSVNPDSWRVFGHEELPLDRIEAFRYTVSPVDLAETEHVPTRRSYLDAIGVPA